MDVQSAAPMSKKSLHGSASFTTGRRGRDQTPRPSSCSTANRTATVPQPSRIKVLISHDDPLISAGLASLLGERCDFEAIVRNPTATASHTMTGVLPSADVVVADYDSGLRLIMSPGAQSNRVMVLTHSDSEARISHALEQGARGYLLMGCSLQELIDGLRAVHVGDMALAPRVAIRVAEWMRQQALTPREADILRQMMLGLSNKAIASRLAISVGTVKVHVKAILSKLHAASRTEAVAIAQRRGILQEEGGGVPARRRSIARWRAAPASQTPGGLTSHRAPAVNSM
jgi:DNA-binding NarL/FixJ family response regulator